MPVKLHIKKGDMVVVNTGKDKGKTGRVLRIITNEDPNKVRAIVEGRQIVIKHTKPNAKHTQGGRIETEASIHISNLNPIDPETKKPTRVGRRKDKDGNTVRYAKKSNKEL